MLVRIALIILLAEVLRKTQSAITFKNPYGGSWG
jgi:hypothetical protein